VQINNKVVLSMKKYLIGVTLNDRQAKELEGLAYWLAEKAYTAERYPEDTEELDRCDKNIRYRFELADALKIPWVVQNHVIIFGQNWRKYKQSSTREILEQYGVQFTI
jgi:hypothetical protein